MNRQNKVRFDYIREKEKCKEPRYCVEYRIYGMLRQIILTGEKDSCVS